MGFDEEVRDGGEESLSAEYIQSALCICKLEPTESESHLYSTILYTGLELIMFSKSHHVPSSTYWSFTLPTLRVVEGKFLFIRHSTITFMSPLLVAPLPLLA